jgi:hypothetical protein
METKVSVQGITTLLSGWIAGLLVTYVFKGHIPPTLVPYIPVMSASALGIGAGWLAKHDPRLEDSLLEDFSQIVDLYNKGQLASPLPPIAQPAELREAPGYGSGVHLTDEQGERLPPQAPHTTRIVVPQGTQQRP